MLALGHHHCLRYSRTESDWGSLTTLPAAASCKTVYMCMFNGNMHDITIIVLLTDNSNTLARTLSGTP